MQREDNLIPHFSSRDKFSRWIWYLVGFVLLFKVSHIQVYHGWDEAFYLSQMTSAVIDRDLMLHNDLLEHPNLFREKFRAVTILMPDGAIRNGFSVGFGVVHSSYTWLHLLGHTGDRFNPGLKVYLATGAMSLLVLTVLMMIRIVMAFGYSRNLSNLAAVLAVAGGPLALYGTRSIMNTHLLSTFWVSIMMLACLSWWKSPRYLGMVAAGLSAGMLAITRWQDLLLVLIVIPASICFIVTKPAPRKWLHHVAAGTGVFAAVASLQLIAWHIQFGGWLLIPQGGAYMHWTHPRVIPFLFSGYHGLIPWVPATALGFAGLFLVRRRVTDPVLRWLLNGMFLTIPLTIYICSCPDWWGGCSYGTRRLSSLAPVAAIGLAGVLDRMKPYIRTIFTVTVLAWALFTLSAFYYQLDDLTLLFTGKPDPFNEEIDRIITLDQWKEPWCYWRLGLHQMVYEHFATVDRPHGVERWKGAGLVFTVMVGSCFLFTQLRRSGRFQTWMVSAVCFWLFVILCMFVFVMPSNRPWGDTWLGVIGGDPPDCTTACPDGFEDVAHIILAVRSVYLNDQIIALNYLGKVDSMERFDLIPEMVLQFAGDEQNHRLIKKWLFDQPARKYKDF
jgi:hypothetical protein